LPCGQRGRQRDRGGVFDIGHTPILYAIIGLFNIEISDLSAFAGGSKSVWVEPRGHKIVGASLAAARRRANLSQQELARLLGKPQSFVSEYERGRRRVDIIEFLLIARTLGANPLDVFAEIMKSAAG
jgi:DNA-binding transcriptional regulator YiaG